MIKLVWVETKLQYLAHILPNLIYSYQRNCLLNSEYKFMKTSYNPISPWAKLQVKKNIYSYITKWLVHDVDLSHRKIKNGTGIIIIYKHTKAYHQLLANCHDKRWLIYVFCFTYHPLKCNFIEHHISHKLMFLCRK